MRNVAFTAWMILWLPTTSLGDYLGFLANGSVVKHYSTDVAGEAALIIIAAWVIVGTLLYERRPSDRTEDRDATAKPSKTGSTR